MLIRSQWSQPSGYSHYTMPTSRTTVDTDAAIIADMQQVYHLTARHSLTRSSDSRTLPYRTRRRHQPTDQNGCHRHHAHVDAAPLPSTPSRGRKRPDRDTPCIPFHGYAPTMAVTITMRTHGCPSSGTRPCVLCQHWS